MEHNNTNQHPEIAAILEDSDESKSTIDYRETIQEASYDEIIQGANYDEILGDYGVKMTDELQEAVQGVIDLDSDQITSEEAAETLQTALQAAEDAPEANLYDDAQRVIETGDLDVEKYKDAAEFDIGISRELEGPDYGSEDF